MMNVQPTVGAIDSGNGFFSAADQRIALASRVTGNETPQQIAFLGQQDKQLQLKQVQDNTSYLYNTAWQDNNTERHKKDVERQRKLQMDGVIFG